ncbi:hypothetical protein KAU32_02360 [bacterium]|nr:hypothetical protein [bacterium]
MVKYLLIESVGRIKVLLEVYDRNVGRKIFPIAVTNLLHSILYIIISFLILNNMILFSIFWVTTIALSTFAGFYGNHFEEVYLSNILKEKRKNKHPIRDSKIYEVFTKVFETNKIIEKRAEMFEIEGKFLEAFGNYNLQYVRENTLNTIVEIFIYIGTKSVATSIEKIIEDIDHILECIIESFSIQVYIVDALLEETLTKKAFFEGKKYSDLKEQREYVRKYIVEEGYDMILEIMAYYPETPAIKKAMFEEKVNTRVNDYWTKELIIEDDVANGFTDETAKYLSLALLDKDNYFFKTYVTLTFVLSQYVFFRRYFQNIYEIDELRAKYKEKNRNGG